MVRSGYELAMPGAHVVQRNDTSSSSSSCHEGVKTERERGVVGEGEESHKEREAPMEEQASPVARDGRSQKCAGPDSRSVSAPSTSSCTNTCSAPLDIHTLAESGAGSLWAVPSLFALKQHIFT